MFFFLSCCFVFCFDICSLVFTLCETRNTFYSIFTWLYYVVSYPFQTLYIVFLSIIHLDSKFIFLIIAFVYCDIVERCYILKLSSIYSNPSKAATDRHTKGSLVLSYPGLESIAEVDIDPKVGFLFFVSTLSSDRFLCVYAPSGYSTRE